MTEALIGTVFRWIVLVTLTIFLGWLVFKVFKRFMEEMEPGQNPRPGVWLEANWGGLGGGLSGWRVSNAFIYLFLLSLLLGCLTLAVFSLPPIRETKDASEGRPRSDSGSNAAQKKSAMNNNVDKKNDTGKTKAEESNHKQTESKRAESASTAKSAETSGAATMDTKTPNVNQMKK
jgi:hypothetical protein